MLGRAGQGVERTLSEWHGYAGLSLTRCVLTGGKSVDKAARVLRGRGLSPRWSTLIRSSPHLALGDAERIEQTWGEKKSKTRKLSAEEETKMLISAMRSCGGRGEEEAPGAEDICADMVKVIMAWRRGNPVPRWEVPALRVLCKDFDPPDTYF
jgi:hypothetical protein